MSTLDSVAPDSESVTPGIELFANTHEPSQAAAKQVWLTEGFTNVQSLIMQVGG